MKHNSPNGRRNHGRPLKRLLDTWDRNKSTRGPTPWQIYYYYYYYYYYYDDDGGDDDDDGGGISTPANNTAFPSVPSQKRKPAGLYDVSEKKKIDLSKQHPVLWLHSTTYLPGDRTAVRRTVTHQTQPTCNTTKQSLSIIWLNSFASSRAMWWGSCKHDSEIAGSIQRGQFFDSLSKHWFSLKYGPTPWRQFYKAPRLQRYNRSLTKYRRQVASMTFLFKKKKIVI